MFAYYSTTLVLIVFYCNNIDIVASLDYNDCGVVNNRPIIGVLAQSTDNGPASAFANKTYIAATYIKYLESAGARVVPIMNDLSDDEISVLFSKINGVLLPGGEVLPVKSNYGRTASVFFKLAKHAFVEKADYFPIWGTCLGLETLSILASGSDDILTHTDSENITLPLKFAPGYNKGRLFRNLPDDLKQALESEPLASNFHKWSVLYETYKKNKNMFKFFSALTTSFDLKGVEFVSTMEGRVFPFFATQWHPEKNAFEWSEKIVLPHGYNAVKAMQFMSNFFVNQARCSKHSFASLAEETASLIYNFPVTYTANVSHLEQCYLFDTNEDLQTSVLN